MALNSSDVPSVSAFILNCFHTTTGVSHSTVFTIISVLLLPVYLFILYLGYQRWRQQRSTIMSHSDFITYHVVVLELVNIVGCIFCCFGVNTDLQDFITLGVTIFSLKLMGQMLFNILTCVERYLAVVHPVTYLSLRTENGIRVRNITIACVWVLNVASMGSVFIVNELVFILLSCFFICACAFLISFFSISILCVLTRPKPGAGDRQWVDQSKLRAFYIIVSILGLLLLRSVGNVLMIILHLGMSEKCSMWFSVLWFGLPNTLVLPVMFLHRAGKLSLCKKNMNSGQESN